jgi:hypothetical protein
MQFIPLYSGKTSKATKHLKDVHACHSSKTLAEETRKRTRDEEVAELKSSLLIAQDPKRMRLLLETRRIVFNQLPFVFGEHTESRVISDVCMKDEFHQPINADSFC